MLERNFHPRPGERGKTYTWAAGVLDDIWGFDPGVFGISPREAEQMDPQQRLLLELAWEALEDAGIPPSRLAGSDAGVFIGASAVDHANLRMIDMCAADAYMMTGNTLSILANRLSYIFDLHGPSFAIDTACSSSLVALNEAVACLRAGRTETAFVGGVSILAAPQSFVGFSQATMLSRRGLCQAFAAEADGYVRAEGGIVLVLKTRAAAERDGDHIHGLIVASAINSDGRTNGISMPSKTYQAKLLRTIYDEGGIDPASLAFIEAHGTGTPVGDPIEAAALGEALGCRRRDPLLIGSVKTNIGHTEAASGLSGLLKAMLALEHDCLPASLHGDTLNPAIDFAGLNLAVARQATPLAKLDGKRRMAGVNSFGFGGTNAHVVLADGPTAPRLSIERAPSFLLLSAHSRAALAALAVDYAAHLSSGADADTVATSTAHCRERLPQRIVVPVGTPTDMAAILASLENENQEHHGAARGTALDRAVPVAFVFSGNGGQFAGMGLAAYARSSAFRVHLDKVSNAFADLAGWSIVDMLHADDLAQRLGRTGVAQPLLFAIQSAACHALRLHGLEPDIVLGHSVGEVAAAEAAGILDSVSALKVIHARSLYQELAFERGGMAVVIGSREAVTAILEDLPDLELAAFNSPRAFTLSGAKATIARLPEVARIHKARVRPLDLAYPFHSTRMAPVERPLLQELAPLSPCASRLPFVSTVTGAVMSGDEIDAAYWWRNVRQPVRFSDAVLAATRSGARVFVEIGPAASLLPHIADTIDDRATTIATIAALAKRDTGIDPLAMTVAAAIARGAEVDETKAFGSGPNPGAAVALPSYPWQRKDFRLPESIESLTSLRPEAWHPLIGSRIGRDQPEWRTSLDIALCPWLGDHRIEGQVLLPGTAFVEMALAVARDWLNIDQAMISDLEITSPMPLAADIARNVACRLSSATGQIEIVSRPRLSAAPWQVHAVAKIVRDPTISPSPSLVVSPIASSALSVSGADVYARTDSVGLNFGPAFRKLKNATSVEPDRIVLELTADDADSPFGVDPGRLDSCFHALMLIFPSLCHAAYVPVRFDSVALCKPGVTFTRARIDLLRCDARVVLADIFVANAAGEPVAVLRGVRFQALPKSRATEAPRQSIRQTFVLASEPTATRHDAPIPLTEVRRALVAAVPDSHMTDSYILLEGWATSLALRTVRALAVADVIDLDALAAARFKKIRPWLASLLIALERSGLCRRMGAKVHIDGNIALPHAHAILATIAREHPSLSIELLAASCVSDAVEALIAGEVVPPLARKPIEAFERNSAQMRAMAEDLIDRLRRALATRPKDRAIRILQVGCGPLTTAIASLAEDARARLTIFDLDRDRGDEARAPNSDRVLVERVEDLPSSAFDLVVASGTLGARVAPAILSSLQSAMAPDAIFIAAETAPSLFRDLVLGLDTCLGGKDFRPSFREADWREAMRAAKLANAEVAHVATGAGKMILLTAQGEAKRRRRVATGTAIIIGDGRSDVPTAFATLMATSGLHVAIQRIDEIEVAQVDEPLTIVMFFPRNVEEGPKLVSYLRDDCLRLKRLAEVLRTQSARLWFVTTSMNGFEAGGASALGAFSRAIANEVPSLDIRRVEIAAELSDTQCVERLCDLVLSGTNETDIRLDPSATWVMRYESKPRIDHKPAEAACLIRERSSAERMVWSATLRQELGSDDVEIQVDAIGLNFRDVMLGLGLLPEDILEHGFAGPNLGLECAGRVGRIGTKVKKLKVGDRVMAFAKSAFATHVVTPARLVAPIPDVMAMEAAATIPVAFLTAYYGLIDCARLKPNEWVLIHGGAGGVGLAAVQVALWRGAHVIATAGSPEKRALLRMLGVDHAFDSRSGAFVDDVRRVAVDGVAVVLNSLTGEAMERSLSLLQPFGRFVELGKRDYVANTHVGLRPFQRNLSYFGVDLDQLLVANPAASQRLLRSVLRLFERGDLVPLPYRVFEANETEEAFRSMQRAEHIGKLIIRPPNPSSISVPIQHHFEISVDKMHLIAGGLGGFGLETARWLAAKGARHIMLIGRNGVADDRAHDTLTALAAQGVHVETSKVDVADKAALQRLFRRFGKDLPPLAGVVHAAMVLEDATLANMSGAAIERVLRPKVAGAHHLDQLTRSMPLDYFFLYSSATTLFGNPGQGAYVAANGYLEGVARRRRRGGFPALAIAWGAISDVGILARSATAREMLATRAGVQGMTAQEALRRLDDVLSSMPEEAVVAVAPIDWSVARQHLPILNSPAYNRLAADATIESGKQKLDIVEIVANAAPDAARSQVAGLIVEEIARVLRLSRDDVARTTPLSEIGLDSLMAVELALGLGERFMLKTPLATTASGFTVNELADHMIALASGRLQNDDALAQTVMERHLGASAGPKITATSQTSQLDRSVTQLLT